MSVRFLNNNASNNTDVVSKTFPSKALTPWVRNPSWPACEANSGDNRVRGLYAVWPNGANFIAMTVSADYTVDFGDGTTTNFGTGVQANYEYTYSDTDLVGTEAPVTFTDSGDLVTRTAHGYSNDMQVQFFNITSTTGISNGQFYYVINATANTFQVSATIGGTAVALTTDGTGQLLPYRIATVTITPQAANDLTSINLFVKHNQSGLANGYSTGWLDLAFAASTITTLTLGSSLNTLRQTYVERVKLNELGAITSFADLFRNFIKLQNIEIATTTTTITNMSSMFNGCSSLQTVPLFNTSSVTNMISMFSSCASLQTVPLFNTSSVTNTIGMLLGCSSLQTVPLFNTAAATNMSSMFSGCSSLQAIPLFNTAAVTNMNSMFFNCFSFQTVPLFDTASTHEMTSMFSGCSSLQTVPLFDTASVTNMNAMFNSCRSLQTVPLFNTAAVTNMSSMFFNCPSLAAVPALVTTAVTSAANFSNMFNACNSLARIEAKNFNFTFNVASNKLSKTALEEIFTNLPTVATVQTCTVTGNFGVDTATTKVVTTTAQSVTVPMASTTGMVVGQIVTGVGTGITTGISVTSDVVADTLTLTSHGLANGTRISFSALGTTTGISLNVILFVVTSTANTFQVALTSGGAAINLTGTNSTLTARYPSFITAITINVSVTLDTPAATTAASTTLTFRLLNSSTALLRNWAATF